MSLGRSVLLVLSGVLSIAFGMLISIQPASGLLAVAWLIGLNAILAGIMYVVVYFESRSLASSLALGLQSPYQTQASPQQNGEHVVHVLHVLPALRIVLSEYG